MTEAPKIGRAIAQERDNDRQLLGARLKEAREYLELSQDEVAKILNVPRSAISLMETGQRKVDVIELKTLAEVYQRPVEFFTGRLPPAKAVPESVNHLARAAAELSDIDRQELLRFAEFLRTRQSPSRRRE